jgi:hypothetical protein
VDPWLSLVIGAALGFLASLALRVFLLRVDEMSARFDETCKDIRDAADLASEYWLFDAADLHKISLMEARLMGHQERVLGMIGILTDAAWFIQDQVEPEMSEFIDASTGGGFHVHGRPADPDRCQSVQIAAARLLVKLRSCRRNLLGLFSL